MILKLILRCAVVNWNKLARNERIFIFTALSFWVISSIAERPSFSEGLCCMELVSWLAVACSVESADRIQGAPNK